MVLEQFWELVFLAIFVSGSIVLLLKRPVVIGGRSYSIVLASPVSPWNLREFLKHTRKQRKVGKSYLFSEQTVFSMGHRFVGRFDQAILHWDESPILDAMIERKFPVSYLPKRGRDEDFFQAGLYSLALTESGVSCSSTRLVAIYCLQDNAFTCSTKNHRLDCFRCRNGRVFERPFSQKKVLRALWKLDEVWSYVRRPRPKPESLRCLKCEFGRNRYCQYSRHTS
jgi:hypothetical protein